MVLPEALSKRFNTQHKEYEEYEEEQKMPYITTAERIGREEGMLAEAREMALEVLDIKFNKVPEDINDVIRRLNNRLLLKKLFRSAIQSKDIQGFRKTIQEINSG